MAQKMSFNAWEYFFYADDLFIYRVHVSWTVIDTDFKMRDE